MPITQSRMAALIIAAQDYQRALTTLISTIHKSTDLESVQTSANLQLLLRDPTTSAATIEREATHYKLTYKGNIKKAEYQLQSRRAKGITPRPETAPKVYVQQLVEFQSAWTKDDQDEANHLRQDTRRSIADAIANLSTNPNPDDDPSNDPDHNIVLKDLPE